MFVLCPEELPYKCKLVSSMSSSCTHSCPPRLSVCDAFCKAIQLWADNPHEVIWQEDTEAPWEVQDRAEEGAGLGKDAWKQLLCLCAASSLSYPLAFFSSISKCLCFCKLLLCTTGIVLLQRYSCPNACFEGLGRNLPTYSLHSQGKLRVFAFLAVLGKCG